MDSEANSEVGPESVVKEEQHEIVEKDEDSDVPNSKPSAASDNTSDSLVTKETSGVDSESAAKDGEATEQINDLAEASSIPNEGVENTIDEEMEAMFGSDLTAVKSVDPNKNLSSADAPADVSESKENVLSESNASSKISNKKPTETQDETNLECMMEALHADKQSESLPGVQKQTETSGLELKDVLQALTEDVDLEAGQSESRKQTDKPKGGVDIKDRKKLKDSKSEGQTKNLKTDSLKGSESDGSVNKIKTEPGSRSSSLRKSSQAEPDSGNEDKDETPADNIHRSTRSSKLSIKTEESLTENKDSSDENESSPKKTQSKNPDSAKELSGSEDTSSTKYTPRQRKQGRISRAYKRMRSRNGHSSLYKTIETTPGSAGKIMSKSKKTCIVKTCKEHCFPELGISLHRFPMPGNPMRGFWMKMVQISPPGPVTAYICSNHFTKKDYNYNYDKDPSHTFFRKLKPFVIPTVGLPVSNHFIQQIKAQIEKSERYKKYLLFRKKSREAAKAGNAVVKKEAESTTSEDEQPDLAALRKSSLPSTSEKKSNADTPGKASEDDDEEEKVGLPKPTLKSSKFKRAVPSTSTPIAQKEPTSTPTTSSKTPIFKKKTDVDTKGRTPGTNCSVAFCNNNIFETRAAGLNVSYYRFPFDNDLAGKWIKKIGDPQLNARTARICSDHFPDKDFEGPIGGGKRNLKPKAVPSLYLTEAKPREPETEDEKNEDGTKVGKKRGRKTDAERKAKADAAFISMPLPIIEDVDIKPEPISDDDDGGLDYEAIDPGLADEEYIPPKKIKVESDTTAKTQEKLLKAVIETPVKRPRGRPRKDGKPPIPRIKTVSFSSLSLPIVSLERLGKRVIDAADSGSLRVRIKESSDLAKPKPRQKPGPKSKRKRPDYDSDSSLPGDDGADTKKKYSKPCPLSKKKLDKPTPPKRKWHRKILKMSDSDTDSDIDDPPMGDSVELSDTKRSQSSKSNVKIAELPKYLLDKQLVEHSTNRRTPENGQSVDDIAENTIEDIESILASNKSDKEKIIQLVEQRISEHTRIIEGSTMGPQQLADHNKILQGSALVLKKLAEKSGKSSSGSPSSDCSPLSPGRTIVLKKVSDPSKLGLKTPAAIKPILSKSESSPGSPSKTPLAIISPQNSTKSTPAKQSNKVKPTVHGEELILKEDSKSCSPLEKIRDYDNLMKKYFSAVLDKNVMSKKYAESKESQKHIEGRLQEKIKELETTKRKANILQAKVTRIITALETFLTPNQIKLALQETKKVAWSPDEMLTAFTIKHLSKACYLFLRHKLNYPLPGISSLQRWMTMLSKDKVDDDEDNIADEDVSDKEDNQELLEDGPGVINEITGTLEEINACGAPGEDFQVEDGTENLKDSNQSSPFQVVFGNETTTSNQGNRKVIILKKVAKSNSKMKMKSKLQINASENDVNVSNIEESDDKNELYKLLPGAKTISIASHPATQKKARYVGSKKIKEKVSFQRLPQLRKDLSAPKPPRIQIIKNEPTTNQLVEGDYHHPDGTMQVDMTETDMKENITDDTHEAGEQKFFTISDLDSSQMEEHVVENVEHMTEDGQIVEKVEGQQIHESLIAAEGMEAITIVKEGEVVEHHQGGEVVQTTTIEDLVNMSDQQITFSSNEDLERGHHFAQIAYSQGNPGEITLHEGINNMTAVVINDIDEEQLNTLLLSNVVEPKGVEIEGDHAFGSKKLVYQTIDHEKNVIVLQPDSQAFIEEDEGTSSGAPRVYIINDEGHIVSASSGESAAMTQEIGYIDSEAFAELGYKLSSDPDHSYSIGNLIENYAIASPTKASKKH